MENNGPRTTRAKIGKFSRNAASFLRYLAMWDIVAVCIIMKALNGFLMTQQQMTLRDVGLCWYYYYYYYYYYYVV